MLACCAVWLAGMTAAWAADGCSRPITVPVSPLGVAMLIGKNQEASGSAIEFLHELARRSQCNVQFIFVPRVRGIQMYLAGEVDLLGSATQTPERDSAGDFVHMFDDHAMLVGLRERIAPLGLPASLLDGRYTVNVIRGYDFGPDYRRMTETLRSQGRLEDVVDPDTLMRKMVAGRADVALISPHVTYQASMQAGMAERMAAVRIDGFAPHHVGTYVSARSLTAADRKRLIAALAELKREQFQWKILQRTLPPWVLAGIRPVD